MAERAGIGKGTVYLYFGSKEALFEEAVRSVIVPVIERIEGMALTPQGSAAGLLRIMFRTFYSQVVATDRRRRLRLMIAEEPCFPRLLAFYPS
ncbi:MAG: TetR/AcrR family transcriptional regulator [Rhodomicrobium sp.]|nr:TetR/AcrR family transcriptional regulator [Rhodomicrobium sp.]